VDLLGLELITTPAGARSHAARAAAATTATLTTEATTATVAATTAVATLAVAAVAAGHRLEAVVGSSRRGSLGRLGVVVGPGLGVVGRSRRGGDACLRLARLARDLDVHPLLRRRHLRARVPLALTGSVGGVVGDVRVAGSSAAQRRLLGGLSVGQGGRGTIFNLGQAGVGDGRVGLGLLLGLDRSLGVGRLRSGFGLGGRSGVGDSNLLNLGDWCRSVMGHTKKLGGGHVQVVCSVSPLVLRVCSSSPLTSFSMVATALSSPE